MKIAPKIHGFEDDTLEIYMEKGKYSLLQENREKIK